jgi:hypothetical protein
VSSFVCEQECTLASIPFGLADKSRTFPAIRTSDVPQFAMFAIEVLREMDAFYGHYGKIFNGLA